MFVVSIQLTAVKGRAAVELINQQTTEKARFNTVVLYQIAYHLYLACFARAIALGMREDNADFAILAHPRPSSPAKNVKPRFAHPV